MKYLPLETASPGRPGYQQQVKEANIKRIFDLVRSGKCESRAQLVRAMQLSATSVSVLVEELTARGLLDEAGPTHTTQPGRRPIGLRLNADAHQIVVFSMQRGGVRYTLLDLNCQILESRFFSLNAGLSNNEEIGNAFIRLFEEILQNRTQKFDPTRALVVCISLPGCYIQGDDAYHMESALGITLSEAPLHHLQERLQLPIYLCSANRSLAYAEKKRLDVVGSNDIVEDLLFVEIRDRISCAIISGGDIYTGPYNIAGEIGHFSIDYRGRPCPCGNVGCLERYVNLSAILEDARQACREARLPEPEDIGSLARRYPSEPILLQSIRQSAQLLAFGLYSVLCSSGMRRIVLGGGIEALGEGFLEEVYHALCSRTLLIKSLDLRYAHGDPNDECVGIAQHFLDKVYTITG